VLLGGSWESEIMAARSVSVMSVNLAFRNSALNCSHDGCLALFTQTYISLPERIHDYNHFFPSVFFLIFQFPLF